MKLHLIFKYLGLAMGSIGGILIFGGIIGFFVGPFLTVAKYWNFFWFASPLLLFAIFCMLAYTATRDKNKSSRRNKRNNHNEKPAVF